MTFTLLDGGMGQELMARSAKEPTPLWATQTMLDSPELVEEIHLDYFRAGADIATTNSYAIHRDRLKNLAIEDQFEALHINACEMACRARDTHGQGKIAGAIGPTGASYRPELALELESAAELYAEIAKIQASYVDFILLETMPSIQYATGAVLGASTAGLPVWLAVSVDDEDGTKLRSGEPVRDIIPLVQEQSVDALLINCSTPEAVSAAISQLKGSGITTGAYANGFTKISDAFKQKSPTVSALQSRHDLDPDAYLEFAKQWRSDGATIIGGCCEVGPNHIQSLNQFFRSA